MTLPLRSPIHCFFARENTWLTASAVVFALVAYNVNHDRDQCSMNVRRWCGKTIQRLKHHLRWWSPAFSPFFSNTQELLKLVYRWSWHLMIPWSRRRGYDTYPTKEAEQQYWLSARVHRRHLQSSDARFCVNSSSPTSRRSKDEYEAQIPVISAYQPALPPLRKREGKWDGEKWKNVEEEYYLPMKAFCKWHRMVYPERKQPSTIKALHMMERYTNEDKREIHRISRMKAGYKRLVDPTGSNEYRKLWDRWVKLRKESQDKFDNGLNRFKCFEFKNSKRW